MLCFLCKHTVDQRKGNGFDDPNLGGNRRRGKCGYDMDEGSPQFMSAYGHMKQLRRDTDVMRSSRERHLDYGEINEFYGEYVADVKDLGFGYMAPPFRSFNPVFTGSTDYWFPHMWFPNFVPMMLDQAPAGMRTIRMYATEGGQPKIVFVI